MCHRPYTAARNASARTATAPNTNGVEPRAFGCERDGSNLGGRQRNPREHGLSGVRRGRSKTGCLIPLLSATVKYVTTVIRACA